MHPQISIDKRLIGVEHPPYLIAEMSANHGGKISNAFKIIEAAKKAGADAVKLQTYHPDILTLKCNKPDFMINEGLWKGRSLHELYSEAYTPWGWHKELFSYAKGERIAIFSTPFDNSSVDLLENLDAPAYKIASFEVLDLPLIKYVASTGKPLIISTGMASLSEIREAIEIALSSGCSQLAILHCVSGYPAPPSEYNLMTLKDKISQFNLVTGLSDHTLSNTTAITSIALGASIIEKHFTLNRDGGGADDSFSIEPNELGQLAEDIRTAWSSLGCVSYERKSSESHNEKFRRSLYAVANIKAGEELNLSNIRSIRPGYGMHPKFLPLILGKKAAIDISLGTALTKSMVIS